MSDPRIGATVLGYPRIGRRREFKHVLEEYRAGTTTKDELQRGAGHVRQDAWRRMHRGGLDSTTWCRRSVRPAVQPRR